MFLKARITQIWVLAAAAALVPSVRAATTAQPKSAHTPTPVSRQVSSRPVVRRATPPAGPPSVYVVNTDTGQEIITQREGMRRAPASLTKLMVIYLAFQKIKSGEWTLDTQLPVSLDAVLQGSKFGSVTMNLHRGDIVKLRDLLTGMIVPSACDAPSVIGEAISGTQTAFVDLMDRTAFELGMFDTQFDNTSGRPNHTALPHARVEVPEDAEKFITPRDVSILLNAIHTSFSPELLALFKTASFTFRGHTYLRTDKDIMFPGLDYGPGMHVDILMDKTGTTDYAHSNIGVDASCNGRNLIAVVMGAPSGFERRRLLRDALEKGCAAPIVPPIRPPVITLESLQNIFSFVVLPLPKP